MSGLKEEDFLRLQRENVELKQTKAEALDREKRLVKELKELKDHQTGSGSKPFSSFFGGGSSANTAKLEQEIAILGKKLEQANSELRTQHDAFKESSRALVADNAALQAVIEDLKKPKQPSPDATSPAAAATATATAVTEAGGERPSGEAAPASTAAKPASVTEEDVLRAALRQAQQATEAARTELADLHQVQSAMNAKISQKDIEIDKFKEKLSVIEPLKAEKERLAGTVAELDDKLKTMKISRDEHMATSKGLLDKLKAAEEASALKSQQISSLKDGLQESQKQLEKAHKELADSQKELASVKKDLTESKADAAQKEKQISALKDSLAETQKQLDKSHKELSDSQRELVNARKDLGDSKGDGSQKEKQISALKDSLAETQKQLERVQREFAEAQRDIAAVRKELADVKGESSMAIIQRDRQLKANESDITGLRASLDAANRHSADSDRELATLEKENEKLEASLEREKKEHDATRTALDEKKKDLAGLDARLTARVVELEKSLQEMTASRDELQRKAETLGTSLAEAEGTIVKGTQERDALVVRIAETEKSLTESRAKVDELETQLTEQATAFEVQIKKDRQSIKELKGDLQKFREAFAAATGQTSGSLRNSTPVSLTATPAPGQPTPPSRQKQDFMMPSDLEVLGEHLGRIAAERFDIENRCHAYEVEIERLKEEFARWKSKVVQDYVAGFRSRVASPESTRSHRRTGSLLSLLKTQAPKTSASEPEEMSRVMHSVLEETLMKNIQLQNDIISLGEECASLQDHVKVLEKIAKDAGLVTPRRLSVGSPKKIAPKSQPAEIPPVTATAPTAVSGSPTKPPAPPQLLPSPLSESRGDP